MDQGYADYLEFYQRGPHAPFLEEHRLAGTAPLRLLKIAQPAGAYPDPPTPDIAIQICTRGEVRGTFDVGAGRSSSRIHPGVMAVLHHNTAGDYVLDGPHEFLVAAIPFAAMRPLLEEASPGFTDFGRLHAGGFQDSFAEGLCRRLWDEAAEGSPLGSLFADSAVQTLALALLRRAELIEAEPEPSRGSALADRRLRRCLDYLNDNLGEDVGLPELANAAGLSPLYFAKVFKRAIGIAPHQYVIQQRVERAETLLAGTSLPLAEVALACGFADQSHLTQAFKRIVGVTPGVYRKERLA